MTSVTNAPRLTAATAEQLAADLFGVRGQASPLPSERDQNFRIDSIDAADGRGVCPEGSRIRPKTAPWSRPRTLRCGTWRQSAWCPRSSPRRKAADIGKHEQYFVRLVTVLPGHPLGNIGRHTDALLADLGRAVGRMDRALASFDHPAIHREFYWDLAKRAGARSLDICRASRMRRCATLVESILRLHHDAVAPRLPAFRRSVIHGDVNDFNVLADSGTNRSHRHRRFRRHGVQSHRERCRHRDGVRVTG
jgi:Ser/Thr protein kinase RdoA (MazF antagonist)